MSQTMNPPVIDLRQEEDCQRIKLEPEQASQVPFPPGCPVLVMDKIRQNRIVCSGEITSVYVSFARSTGSCDNCYQVASASPRGEISRQIVSGAQLRYSINCPVKVVVPNENPEMPPDISLNGIIVGFESQPVNAPQSPSYDSSSFLYTVEAMVYEHSRGTAYRQRGVSPAHIRFRPSTSSDVLPYFNEPKPTSVVSFDEVRRSGSLSGESDDGETTTSAEKRLKVEDDVNLNQFMQGQMMRQGGTPTSTGSAHSCSSSRPEFATRQPTRQPIQTNVFTKCTPLKHPIPSKFEGDMEKCKNEAVPEFACLVNFPNTRHSLTADGMKNCVMCGHSRLLTSPKMNAGKLKGKEMSSAYMAIIPAQNKGLCTFCDINVWKVNCSGQQIKWCKGCKNFQNWAAFGEKGSATKCVRCRERQREKYAASKSKLEKKNSSSSISNDNSSSNKRKSM